MQLEKIAQYDDGKGLMLGESIREAEKHKLRLPANLEIDNRIVNTDEWKKEKEVYPCRTGTFICYEKPDRAFNKTLEWEGYKVLIPKEFQGKAGIALVCNHPDFKLTGNIFSSNKFQAIELPRQDGWYDTEPRFGIPIGEKKGYADNRRYLWQRDNEEYIGLLARRYCGFYVMCRRYVDAYYLPTFRHGVFGTATGKFKLPKHKHLSESDNGKGNATEGGER